jgi:quercetin dioxygenase-like cupin family protein
LKIIRGRDETGTSEQRTTTFTGMVFADPVLPATDGVTINTVFFAPCARTHWHTHERGQLLHVTAGAGRICSEGGPVEALRAGDIVWVPAGERHWHGAGENSYLVHVAVSLGTTRWEHEVTTAEYSRTPATELQEQA